MYCKIGLAFDIYTSKVKVIFELAQLGADKIHCNPCNMCTQKTCSVDCMALSRRREGVVRWHDVSLHSSHGAMCDEFHCLLRLLWLPQMLRT